MGGIKVLRFAILLALFTFGWVTWMTHGRSEKWEKAFESNDVINSATKDGKTVASPKAASVI